MPPKRVTNAQRRTAPVTLLPPSEAARVVLGFSPEAPIEAGTVVNLSVTAKRPLVVLRLLIGGTYVELFDVVDLLVAGVPALDSHAQQGVTARAFHEDKSPPLLPLRAEEGESILLRVRNRATKPLDFRAWVLTRPVEDDAVAALPAAPRRVR